MAVLTRTQVARINRKCFPDGKVLHTVPIVISAVQAIEDFIEANKATISADIDTATAPFVFTNAEKKRLVAYYFEQKFKRELV